MTPRCRRDRRRPSARRTASTSGCATRTSSTSTRCSPRLGVPARGATRDRTAGSASAWRSWTGSRPRLRDRQRRPAHQRAALRDRLRRQRRQRARPQPGGARAGRGGADDQGRRDRDVEAAGRRRRDGEDLHGHPARHVAGVGSDVFPTWSAWPAIFASLVAGNRVVVQPHPSAVLPLAITVQVCQEVLAEAGYDHELVTLAVGAPGDRLHERLAVRPEVRLIDFTGPCQLLRVARGARGSGRALHRVRPASTAWWSTRPSDFRRPVRQPGEVAGAVQRADDHGAAEPPGAARRHRHRRGPQVAPRGRRRHRGRARPAPVRRRAAPSRSWVRSPTPAVRRSPRRRPSRVTCSSRAVGSRTRRTSTPRCTRRC